MSARLAASPLRDDPITAHGLLAALGDASFPLELDRLEALAGGDPRPPAAAPLAFRFCFGEIPFQGHAERRDGRVVVTLEGTLGTLPFTIESARRRRRLGKLLVALRRRSGSRWAIDGRQRVTVRGEIALDMPLTPAAVVTGIVALLLRERRALDFVVAVAGED